MPQRWREPSLADLDLVARAAERGVELTDSKIRRWRKIGLIPAAPRASAAGRGHGRPNMAYPDDTLEQVVFIDGFLHRHRNINDVLFWSFAGGRWVDLRRLRTIATRSLQRGLTGIAIEGSRDRLIQESVEKPRTAGKRLLRAAYGVRYSSKDSVVESFLYGIGYQAFEASLIPEHEKALHEILREFVPNRDVLEKLIDDHVRTVDLSDPGRTLSDLSDAQLLHGRDTWSLTVDAVATLAKLPAYEKIFTPIISDLLRPSAGIDHIIGAIIVSQWERSVGDDFRDRISLDWRGRLPAYPASRNRPV